MSFKYLWILKVIALSVENLNYLLPDILKSQLEGLKICEIRLRIGHFMRYYDGKKWTLLNQCALNTKVSRSDIEYILGVASGYSVYSISDSIVSGYIHCQGGIRIGVCGEGVLNNGRLSTQKDISCLAIRVPSEVKGCADNLIDYVFVENEVKNTIIISPPAAGKTTLLRELSRLISDKGKNTLIVDERFELAASVKGVSTFDVGENTDVISGVPKLIAYENAIRAMNPDVIVTDEIYKTSETEVLSDACRAGVKILASIHADSEKELENSSFCNFLKLFDVKIVLSKKRKVGEIIKIVKK